MLGGGLLLTAFINVAFGFSYSVPVFTALWFLNGSLQVRWRWPWDAPRADERKGSRGVGAAYPWHIGSRSNAVNNGLLQVRW